LFNGPFFRTTQVNRYQKGKTNLDFTGARDSEWQWHQLGYMQVCTSLQTDNTPAPYHSVFLQAGCPSCCPTNSVKALKALSEVTLYYIDNVSSALKCDVPWLKCHFLLLGVDISLGLKAAFTDFVNFGIFGSRWTLTRWPRSSMPSLTLEWITVTPYWPVHQGQ